jgi:hypothetical protein
MPAAHSPLQPSKSVKVSKKMTAYCGLIWKKQDHQLLELKRQAFSGKNPEKISIWNNVLMPVYNKPIFQFKLNFHI